VARTLVSANRVLREIEVLACRLIRVKTELALTIPWQC
jgi:hypothetical protein